MLSDERERHDFIWNLGVLLCISEVLCQLYRPVPCRAERGLTVWLRRMNCLEWSGPEVLRCVGRSEDAGKKYSLWVTRFEPWVSGMMKFRDCTWFCEILVFFTNFSSNTNSSSTVGLFLVQRTVCAGRILYRNNFNTNSAGMWRWYRVVSALPPCPCSFVLLEGVRGLKAEEHMEQPEWWTGFYCVEPCS